MTVHDLHDALNLLPSDLITAADSLRMTPKAKVIPWKRILPVAACLILVLGLGLMLPREMLLSHIMMKESAPEAPAAAAPVPEEQKITADAAEPELPSDVGIPEVPAQESSGSKNGIVEGVGTDHSHRFAEAEEPDQEVPSGFDGNLTVTVVIEGESYSLTGADGLTMTEILTKLNYDPSAVCRCMAEFTVDTEPLSNIQVSLEQAFARCEKGQAALTEQQVTAIREIINCIR